MFKHLFTEGDNTTYCPARVMTGIVAGFYHIIGGIGLLTNHLTLDMVNLGLYLQHMMTLIGAGSLSVGVKSIMKADADGVQSEGS